jgi:XTP/dITP diphosphohydrolase
VVLATSARVAPGLLSAQAWDALRSARRVLTGWPDHPQLPALAEAGIDCRVAAESDPDSLASLLDQEVSAAAPGSVVWLAAPDGWLAGPGARVAGPGARVAADGDTVPVGARPSGPGGRAGAPDGRPGLLDGHHAAGALLAALGALPGGGPEVELLPGSYDLPGARLLDLVATMDTLRVNCPWDAKQTHETLAPHLIEESYEALEALEDADQAALREELGDVLLQVAFHARVAAERADGTGYTIDDVADGIVAKLVRRHPHVFGTVEVSGADEVKQNWDAIKAAERASADGAPGSALDGVPFGQPALALAAQLQRRAERSGVPADLIAAAAPGNGAAPAPGDEAAGNGAALAPSDEAADDGAALAPGDEAAALGEQLFLLVERARAAGLDPELELRAASRRYRDRVRAWEQSRPPASRETLGLP